MKCILLSLLAIGLASAGVLHQPSELLRTLHKLMSADELSRTFGVDNSSSVDDYEVIYIRRHHVFKTEDPLKQADDFTPRKRSGPHDNHAHYSFAANGKNYNLKVKPNKFLMAPAMKTIVRDEKTGQKVMEERTPALECHFLQIDGENIAAISHCSEDDIHGYVIDGGKPLEIRPISARLRKMLHPPVEDENDFVMVGAHILRAVDPLPHLKAHQAECDVELPIRQVPITQAQTILTEPVLAEPEVIEKRKGKPAKAKSAGKNAAHGPNALEKSVSGRQAPNKVLELGIFIDQAAMDLFMPYLGAKEYVKLRELVLAFVNGMQALYYLPSLGQRVDLSIVYMEFHAKAPAGLTTSGERGKLLESFCAFQKKLNKPSDSDAEHWDMSLLLSGLDFYAVESGRNNYITMGLATVTGVCTNEYNCVIGEFGITNQNGQPYPSTGFTSLYVMAHEIGHNLGMSHDSSGNTCATEGFIMSPSRGVVGETTWSTCSASTLASITVTCMNDMPTGNFPDYNHNKLGNTPGQIWSADEQCRILLRDKAAQAYYNDASEICNSMKCRTPNRDGFFTSGPALPGTVCGSSKWCDAGKCVSSGRSLQGRTSIQGGWSQWKSQPCSSGCLVKSKGAVVSERECDNPKPSDVLMRCDGASLKVALCDDAQPCLGKMRLTPAEYAAQQCAKFSQHVPSIDPKAEGMQADYSPKRPWQSCAIFCKRSQAEGFYTPRMELNSLPEVSAYFPDGTWCGNDGQKDLFCLQRTCVAQESTEGLIRNGATNPGDLDMMNNAPMTADHQMSRDLKKKIQEFYTLDKNGKPIKEQIDPETIKAMENNANSHSGHVDDDFITLKH